VRAQALRGQGILPPVAHPVATLARSTETCSAAHALERTADGRWLLIAASPLEGNHDARVAVRLRRATAAEAFDLLCRAYAPTRREREVVSALIAGLDSRGVSARLFISRHS